MRLPIRAKLVLFIGLPAAAILVTAMLWILAFAEQQARSLAQAQMAERAASAAARFDDYIGKAARIAETTARFVEQVPDINEDQIYGMLEGTVMVNRRIYGAAIAFEPGTYRPTDALFCPYVHEAAGGGDPVHMNIDEDVYDWYRDQQWDWWHLPKKLQRGVWTDPYLDEGAGNVLMTTFSAPFERDGGFGGVTTVDIDLERLEDDVEAAITGIGEFLLLGPEGEIIFSPRTEDIMAETIFERLERIERPELGEAIKTMLGGGSGKVTVAGLFRNEPTMVAYAPVTNSGWTFITYRSEREVLAVFRQQRTAVVGAFVAAVALMAATVLFVSAKLARPIRSLRGKVLRIAEGDANVSVDNVRTGDEIEELAGAFGTMQRKVADREAKLEHARESSLTELLESAPDAMIVFSQDGTICRVNEKVGQMFGYGREELLGGTLHTLMPERLMDVHSETMSDYFTKSESPRAGVGLESTGLRKNGREFPVEVALSPFHEPGGVMAVAAIRDITERKEAETELKLAREQADAANHAKSEFLSSMSHELRTPLNGILGYAQILERDKAATPKQRDNVDSIISCGDHLLSLINDVLDLSKIEAGRLELQEEPCDLPKLIDGLTKIVGERARSKGLAFRTEVAPEIPRGIITDTAKLRQVLVNLLGNAVKFTVEGGVTLRLDEAAGPNLVFEIIDTGVGMAPHELEEIFDPFKQVAAGKAAGGTGLGLAITQRLVTLMGGRIEVESDPGSGSCFRVCLPMQEIDEEDLGTLAENLASALAEASLAPGQTARILVADDRETNRDILDQMLTTAGFEVTLADDGDTALERLGEAPFDLVLLDVRMPRLNGLEVVRRIRAEDRWAKLPVIAVTASVFPEFREKALATGFSDFLAKPFRAGELMQRLKQHLDLAWTDEGADEPAPAEASAPTDSPSTPSTLPPDACERFRAALKIKNLTALKALAADLQGDPATEAAGAEIARLARAFNFAGLAALAQELNSESSHD